MLSIQIITYNSEKIIQKCVESLLTLNLNDFEIIIIDNASTDKTIKVVEKLKEKISNIVIVKNSYNAGFGKAHNQASLIAKGSTLLILNPDTIFLQEIQPGYLENLIKKELNSLYGFLFYNENKTIQATIGVFPNIFRVIFDRIPILKNNMGIVIRNKRAYQDIHNVDWVCGCGVLVSKKDFVSVGGFDEKYFLYCEDIDLSKKLKDIGLNTVYDPGISFIHIKESRSDAKKPKKYFRMRQSLSIYFKKYRPSIEQLLLSFIIKIEAILKNIHHSKNKDWKENLQNIENL